MNVGKHSPWHIWALALRWALSHRCRLTLSLSKPLLPSLCCLSLPYSTSPALWTQYPLIVTSTMPLIVLPVGPDSPCAPSRCSLTLPLGSRPLLRSSSPCGSSPCSRVSPPHFPCTPPPRALKVFSASHSCLQVFTFSRGLLHQSPQSKINEGKPEPSAWISLREKAV